MAITPSLPFENSPMSETLWQTKLHARLHDPAEKALVLMRDPAGHEGGTSRAMHYLLGFYKPDPNPGKNKDSGPVYRSGNSAAAAKFVKRADHWAAAGDRPEFPRRVREVQKKTGEEITIRFATGDTVRWAKTPVLIHPLTGDTANLGTLNDTDYDDIRDRAFGHLCDLLDKTGVGDDAPIDWKKLALSLWRFGPEVNEEADNGTLGELWKFLPADTRIPDHSIWDHLDLVSAFAGAFAADDKGEVALFSLAIGPVQSFIAAARSTSDLWAGSHLLSRLAWEVMRPICEAYGPDAVLFPRLRGIPQVDLWLKEQCGVPGDLFKDCDWNGKTATDANPLFSAALPNRLVALVPASEVKAIAARCEAAVREWLQALGKQTVDQLLETAGLPDAMAPAYAQMRDQLAGFPEVHWAAVPFSLIEPKNVEMQKDLDVTALKAAMAPFYGTAPDAVAGFLASPAWTLLQKDIPWGDDTIFFSPNPGVLYPAVYELAERMLAAAKTARSFAPLAQTGWRDSLTGESEWLTFDRAQLALPPGQRVDTLWTKIADRKPAWAKPGEHLGGLSAVKRLWPTLFAAEVAAATGATITRFVVSTHTMSLAKPLANWLAKGAPDADRLEEKIKRWNVGPVALPAKLLREHGRDGAIDIAKRIPALFDLREEAFDPNPVKPRRRDSVENAPVQLTEDEINHIESLVTSVLMNGATSGESADARIETYYALVMLDGDHMGKILSGDSAHAISYFESFHPHTQQGFKERAANNPALKKYGDSKRALSPNRHLAISGALNDYSQIVVRHIVEREFFGRLIYAGGDDVLAMLPVADALACIKRLRQAYSGHDPIYAEGRPTGTQYRNTLILRSGFAYLNGRLMRMMGTRATASAGLVIAHHQAPLSVALRELRSAEQRAKNEGGRDAFSISLMKRSGGTTHFTEKWATVDTLLTARDFLILPTVSRRAVYHTLEWLVDLPGAFDAPMLKALLTYQLQRQCGGGDEAKNAKKAAVALAEGLIAEYTTTEPRLGAIAAKNTTTRPGHLSPWKLHLRNLLTHAEFLARETRGSDPVPETSTAPEAKL